MFPVDDVVRVISSAGVSPRPAPGLIECGAGMTSRGWF
jgi:hypothetical protein